jgi:hypothetical protein
MTIILAGALLVVLQLLPVIFLRRETLEGRDGILDEPYDIFAPIKVCIYLKLTFTYN